MKKPARYSSTAQRLGFTLIPNTIFDVDLGLTGDELLLVLGLKRYQFKRGARPFVTFATLSKMVGASTDRLRRASKSLDEKGLVKRDRKTRRRSFHFNLDPLDEALDDPTKPLKPKEDRGTDVLDLQRELDEARAEIDRLTGVEPQIKKVLAESEVTEIRADYEQFCSDFKKSMSKGPVPSAYRKPDLDEVLAVVTELDDRTAWKGDAMIVLEEKMIEEAGK